MNSLNTQNPSILCISPRFPPIVSTEALAGAKMVMALKGLGIDITVFYSNRFAFLKNIPLENLDADVKEIMKIGPFAKWDYLGLDVIYNTLKYFEKAVSSDFTPGKTLSRLVSEGKLGRKTGGGLFKWINGTPQISLDKKANILDLELFMAIQLNEGCKLLEEEVVSGYKIIDDTMLAAMDMPGPFGMGKKNHPYPCDRGQTSFLVRDLPGPSQGKGRIRKSLRHGPYRA